MPAAQETHIEYIPQSDRTVIVRVKNPGEEPFELIADVYSDEELEASQAGSKEKR